MRPDVGKNLYMQQIIACRMFNLFFFLCLDHPHQILHGITGIMKSWCINLSSSNASKTSLWDWTLGHLLMKQIISGLTWHNLFHYLWRPYASICMAYWHHEVDVECVILNRFHYTWPPDIIILYCNPRSCLSKGWCVQQKSSCGEMMLRKGMVVQIST